MAKLLELVPASNKQSLWYLMQMYFAEMSQYALDDVNSDGIYEYQYFDCYWQEDNRYPYHIIVGDKIAGFCLVNTYTEFVKKGHSIAEFYILPRYRKQGIATKAALEAFQIFPGDWEVKQINSNTTATLFWKGVIAHCSNDSFLEHKGVPYTTQTFNNS